MNKPLPPADAKTAADGDLFWRSLPDATRAALTAGGIRRAIDLALTPPLRHENRTRITPMSECRAGAARQIEGEIVETRTLRTGRGRQFLVCLADNGGQVILRFFRFNRQMEERLVAGVKMRAFGNLVEGNDGLEIRHPRLSSPARALAERLTPVYSAIKKIEPQAVQRLVARALESCDLSDTLADDLRAALDFPSFADALSALHYPAGEDEETLARGQDAARRRLAFDEALATQMAMRQKRARAGAAPIIARGAWADEIEAALPFALTAGQARARDEIFADLARGREMRRLLHGDVGSGKTIVAFLACAAAAEAGFAAALMAPTEILAAQHLQTFSALLAPLGCGCEILTGAQTTSVRRAAQTRIMQGESRVVVGTHALFQEGARIPRLALAVIDEQQRFGVEQRRALIEKNGGGRTHLLMMSATPIPRTLAMGLFADMDLSALPEKPANRAPTQTAVFAGARRFEALDRVAARARQGAQAYWICPLIDHSEAIEARNVNDFFAQICARHPDLKVAVLHGRMAAADKTRVMDSFRGGEISLLLATTIIEVGVDAPSADIIVIENAERLGLSQLHQLRGRVGRGGRRGYCALLFDPPLTTDAKKRLSILRESSDGFAIARIDLQMRGPGEWFGARQSGLPILRFARLDEDEQTLRRAREVADKMLSETPAACERHIERWLGETNFWQA